MLYGDSNAGKTFLAGTAQDVPELSPVVVANIDKGATTLLSRGDIQVADISNASDAEELLWMLARKDPSVANVKTLVMDGTSELQKLDLADIALSEANKSGSKRDKDANELRDYMKNKNKLLRILRMARDISGITLILTAWAAKTYPNDNKNSDPSAVFPDMTAAVRSTLVGYMDDVFYLAYDAKADKRYLYTGSMGPVFAKCRDAAVAAQLQTEGKPYLVNPTFTDIYKAYRRAYDVEIYKKAKGVNS
jgi:phage nucleotide-binding protein